MSNGSNICAAFLQKINRGKLLCSKACPGFNFLCICNNSSCREFMDMGWKLAKESCGSEFKKIVPAMGSKNSCKDLIKKDESNNDLVLILLICGIVFAIMILVAIFYYKNNKKKRKKLIAPPSYFDVMSEYSYQQSSKGVSTPSDLECNYLENGKQFLGESVYDSELLMLQINNRDIFLFEKIGSGSSGEVWLGKYNQEYVAVKKLNCQLQNNIERVKNFVVEIKIMANIDHPHIVKCYGAYWTNPRDIGAVMEYVENGDLKYLINETKDLQTLTWEKEKYLIVLDMLEALMYIHSLNIIHRDLKSHNVLITKDLRGKLTDFGISRTREVWQESTMTGGMGTLFWMAPEILSGAKTYDSSADIYSFGVILVELDTMELPFAQSDVPVMEIPFRVSREELKPEASASCPKPIKNIIDACLNYDPSKRPTSIELHHLWTTTVIENAFL